MRLIWGVGAATQSALDRAGIRTFADLRRWDRKALADRFGSSGDRLWRLSRGEDSRKVSRDSRPKSISNETTFHEDTADLDLLDGHLWRLSEKVSDRAKAKGLEGRVVTLKLKRASHALLTRRVSLSGPTQLADAIYRAGRELLARVGAEGPYRLLGIGLSQLSDEGAAATVGDLLDPDANRRAEAERASDAIRARFGPDAILKGRSLR